MQPKKENGKTELNSEKTIIFITVPVKGYDDYSDYNKHAGERIYIFFDHKKVLLRSIDNFDSFSFKIQNGENSANEKTIINAIKLAANSHFELAGIQWKYRFASLS